MKLMASRLLLALFAIGLCADVFAQEKQEYPRISICGPGGGKTPVGPDEFITLVVEGPVLSYDKNLIASTEVVEYVNKLLEVKKVSYIGVYTREGTKYGDVIRAIDILRGTTAKNIGLSMQELAPGRQP